MDIEVEMLSKATEHREESDQQRQKRNFNKCWDGLLENKTRLGLDLTYGHRVTHLCFETNTK